MKKSNLKTRPEEAEKAVAEVSKVKAEVEPAPGEETIEQEPENALEKLSKKETEDLAGHEATITKNQAGYWASLAAYEAIHRGRLYKSTHTSFEAYCEERWGVDRSHANRWIKASRFYENLKCLQIGDKALPVSESTIRPLTRLSPDKQQEGWARALEKADGGRVTMKVAEAVVAEMLPAKEKKAKPAEEPPAEAVRDEPLEEEITRLLRRLQELTSGTTDAKIRDAIKELALHYGVEEAETDMSAKAEKKKSRR